MHEMGHVLGLDDQQAGNPTTVSVMTETLGDGIRRTLSGIDLGPQVTSGKWQAASDPNSSRLAVDDSGLTSAGAGFSFTQLRGLFNSGTQRAVTSVRESGSTHPVVEWADEDTFATPASVSVDGVKMKSSWLSKFLSATGVKQDRAATPDFEVALSKKK
jgi:hypothetical protein